MRDFTIEKYRELCLALLDSGYAPRTVYSYLEKESNSGKSVILRHDIDRKAKNALKMAELNQKVMK